VPPRRIANGVDRNRLSLVLATLARNGGPSLGSSDVFVSVAGGVRIEEPGADLAVALALASAARGEPLARGAAPLACFGEVGLTGELRYVAHAERRLEEAARFGLEQVIVPKRCLSDTAPSAQVAATAADSLSDALRLALDPPALSRAA
jgi:DNA repair protein RadA/Sms